MSQDLNNPTKLSISDINDIFERWDSLSPSDKLKLVKEFKLVGKLSYSRIQSTENSVCPIYRFPLSRPCNLKECAYFTESKGNRNCLLSALETSKTGRLPLPTISALLGISVSEINKINASAIKKVKKSIIRDRLESYSPVGFRYLENHCIGCGLSIHEEFEFGHPASLTIINGYGWCSNKCKENKPAWEFKLEHEFNYDRRDILRAAYSVLRSSSAVSAFFGISLEAANHRK